MTARKLHVAAVGDIHVQPSNVEDIRNLFAEIQDTEDVLVLCGDLTQTGSVEEAHLLAHELRAIRIPTLAVLGNHDYHQGAGDEIARIVSEAGTIVLNGTQSVVGDVGFAGVKGFGGGFSRYMLSPFGEAEVKAFVQEADREAALLDQSLRSLSTEKKIAVLHYAPIVETVKGEPEEIFPFLGCSRLMKPIDDSGVLYAVHGHAHHGTLHGKTTAGVDVYNCAYPLLNALPEPRRYVSLIV
jgi:Icc-related predicted phosphoesterase